MSQATVTSKGQVTIPADIRRALGLEAGHKVVFTRLSNGTTIMRAKTHSILELRGILADAPRGKSGPVSIEDMNIGRD